MSIIFTLEIVAGVYAYVEKEEVQVTIEQGIQDAMNKQYAQYGILSKGITKVVDWFQENVNY